MSVAHGGTFAASAGELSARVPWRAKRRANNKGTRKSGPVCYVVLHRARGGQGDGDVDDYLRSDERKFLRVSDALFMETTAARPIWDEDGNRWILPSYPWDDWYAVPIPVSADGEENGIETIRALARKYRIWDGPYWGRGRVAERGTGDTPGALPLRMKPAAFHRANERLDEAQAGYVRLMKCLHGSLFPAESRLPYDPSKDPLDYLSLLGGWQHTAIDWCKMAQRFPTFPRLYTLAVLKRIDGTLAECAMEAMQLWAQSRIAPPKTDERETDNENAIVRLRAKFENDEQSGIDPGLLAQGALACEIVSRNLRDARPPEMTGEAPAAPDLSDAENAARAAALAAARQRDNRELRTTGPMIAPLDLSNIPADSAARPVGGKAIVQVNPDEQSARAQQAARLRKNRLARERRSRK